MTEANTCPSCSGQTRALSESEEHELFWGVESPLDALNLPKIGFTLFKNVTNTISSAVDDKKQYQSRFFVSKCESCDSFVLEHNCKIWAYRSPEFFKKVSCPRCKAAGRVSF